MRKPVCSLLRLLAWAALIPCAAVLQAEPLPVPESGTVEPLAASVADELAAITPEKFPDADNVIARNSTVTRYAADGTSRTVDDMVIKVLTEKGRKSERTQSFGYNTFYEELKILQACVLKADGSVVAVDAAKNSKEMTDQSTMSMNIYDPNERRVVLVIPQLAVGDAVRVVTEKTVKKTRMTGAFFDWQGFESYCPIVQARYEVRGPKEKPLKSQALLAPVAGTVKSWVTEEGGENVYVWEARDVPQAFPEPDMPSFYTCTQRLLVSTLDSWEEVSRWYWNISEPHLQPTPEILEKVRELTEEAKDDAEKIDRVFRFVSQEIRYMGITVEKEAPGYEPHDVKLTFDNRYGVCRDKAALLVTMLRAAGLDAYPVLIMAGPKIDPTVPVPYFNHAITAVKKADGSYILMDSTDEHTKDIFPAYLFNKSYIVANPSGETLRVSPVAPAEENMLVATTTLRLDGNGSVAGETTFDFFGINDNACRGAFAQAKPDDIRRGLESMLKGSIPGATMTGLDVSPKNMLDTRTTPRITMQFTAEDFFLPGSSLLPTPWFGSRMAVASKLLGQGTGLEKRRFPLEIAYTCGLRETLRIELPENASKLLALPENEVIETPALRYEKVFQSEGNVLTGNLELKLIAPEVSAADYAGLKQALRDIEYAKRQQPVFAGKKDDGPSADVRVLENGTFIELQDAHSWKTRSMVKKNILTYAGKKASGELHLAYNPAWETVKLLGAKVRLADGSERTVQAEEINEMDASWVAAAPRYPAAKTLVVSLPGVEVGGTVEYEIERTTWEKPFFSIGNGSFSFEPMDRDEFTLTAPKELRLFLHNEMGATVEQAPDDKVRIAVTQSVPASAREDSLPPAQWLAPVLQVSSLASPAPYAEMVRTAVEPCLRKDAAVTAKAEELVAGAKTDAEKILRIRDFVAKEIRPAGPNFTQLPLRCLSPAAVTLQDGYGHEADRSILLSSLLQAAGFAPQLVLATNRTGAEFYWKPGQPFVGGLFTRLVTRLPAATGWLYLDNLSIYAAPGTTGLEGAWVLSLENPVLEKVEVAPEFTTLIEASYAVELQENGDAKITVQRRFPGVVYGGFNRWWAELTPENKSRFHQQVLAELSQAAQPDGELQVELAYPGLLRFSAIIPKYAVQTGDYLYCGIPGAVRSVVPAGADTRKQPLFMDKRIAVRTDWTFVLPEGMAVTQAPDPLTWEGPGGLGQVRVTCQEHRDEQGRRLLFLRTDAHLNPGVVPAANYSSLLEINRRMGRPEQNQLLLKKQEGN